MKGMIYPLRDDLSIKQFQENGEDLVLIYDPFNYSQYQVTLSIDFFVLISLIDKEIGYNELPNKLNIDLNFVELFYNEYEKLDDLYFLDSPKYNDYRLKLDADFLSNNIRNSVLSGKCFPENENEFKEYMHNLFSLTPSNKIKGGAFSSIIPHLDLLTGNDTKKLYASSFHSLRDNDFDLLVIFGTAHYRASHRFMLSEKNFSSPLGISEIDLELMNEIKKISPTSFTVDEYAHRYEHSIEIQTALSSYYFEGKKYKILPILTSGYFDFIDNNTNPDNDSTILSFVTSLQQAILNLGRKAIFIASVDFSHFGEKFADDFDAISKLDEANQYDLSLIQSINNNDYNDFFSKINDIDDLWKICGTASIFTLMKYQGSKTAEFLGYNMWYEKTSKSAVSCASISFYN
ncbi:MAG TPA: AmmeMemoRadiSam system protein B [Candidatus Kapabacteria bacterium]|nr:AmmeMemoRadiSam system protein B [Candidatus Kapabacteria bacterium]